MLPEEIVKFTTTCRIINVSVHDEVRNLLNNNEATAALGALLGQIRDTAHADGSKTVNLVFHASTGELDYIRAICGAMQAASQRDNDDKRNPFVRFFKKSPNALLYHHGNAVKPDQKGFEKEKFVTLETFDCFDTPREHLFTTIQGKMCAWWTQEENAESLRKVEFKARAVELEYSRGRLFHLSVKAPDDGTYLPSKRDICYVRLRGVTRVMPEVERIVDPEATAELIFRVSFDALAAMDIETYIRSRCQEFFNPEQLTDEMVDEIKFGPTEASCDRKARIKSLVTKWAQEGYLAITEKTSPASTELADKCEWWRAQRISTVLPGTPPGSVSFLVTLPLVPKSEGPKTGLASMINVQFPILKWDTVKVTGSRDVSLGKFIEDHFADEETELTVLFRKVLSDQSTRRAIFALNDLCCPQIADEKFPVSEQSIRTYRYLQNFRNGETGNVFEKFPHMENILTNPEQVPEHLRRCWENMDITKQEAYRGLANITQNIHWIAGVAGTGKSNLLQFIVLMAMLGDKNKEHPIKVLDLLPRNKAVSDFANEMAAAFEELGKKNAVIRLRSFESEIDDWISTRVLGEDRQDLINEEEAKWAWAELGDESVIQNQLAQLATSIHDERAQTTKYSSFSLQQQAHSFLEAHKENFPRLRGALDELAKQGLGDDEVDMISDMKVLVTHLYAVFLKQFTGVIVATPGSGCHSNLVRNFKADIVMIDDASCVGEAEFLMAIRYHNPKFFVVVGDPNQPGHFVHESYDRPVTNPFTEFLKRSPLERALSYGGVVKSQLASNHRGKNDLSALASKIIYHRSLLPAAQGEAAWSPETPAWCEWLRKHCPTLIHGHQRILLELQGAVASKVGTSSINMAHIEHACTLVVQAIQDDKLKGMNGKKVTVLVATFYMAQKAKYAELFDELVFRKTLTHQQRRQIDVRTVDDAQGFAADLVIVDFVKTSSPGFTCDRRRLCVAITRARQAEIILMSRGMFIGRKPSPEDPTGHDVRLLAKIYTEVALTRGIVTKSVAPMPKKTTETVAGGDRAAADHGLVPNVIKCYNCGKSGHGQRECLKPLNHVKTGHKAKGHSNLKQSGHPKAARKQKDVSNRLRYPPLEIPPDIELTPSPRDRRQEPTRRQSSAIDAGSRGTRRSTARRIGADTVARTDITSCDALTRTSTMIRLPMARPLYEFSCI